MLHSAPASPRALADPWGYALARHWLLTGQLAACLAPADLAAATAALATKETWRKLLQPPRGQEDNEDSVGALRLLLARLVAEAHCSLLAGSGHGQGAWLGGSGAATLETDQRDWALADQPHWLAGAASLVQPPPQAPTMDLNKDLNLDPSLDPVLDPALDPTVDPTSLDPTSLDPSVSGVSELAASSLPPIPSLEDLGHGLDELDTEALLLALAETIPPPGLRPVNWVAAAGRLAECRTAEECLAEVKKLLEDYHTGQPAAAHEYAQGVEALAAAILQRPFDPDPPSPPPSSVGPPGPHDMVLAPSRHARRVTYAQRMARMARSQLRRQQRLGDRPAVGPPRPHPLLCASCLATHPDTHIGPPRLATALDPTLPGWTADQPRLYAPLCALADTGPPDSPAEEAEGGQWADTVQAMWHRRQRVRELRSDLVQHMQSGPVQVDVPPGPSLSMPGLVHGHMSPTTAPPMLAKAVAAVLTAEGFTGARQQAMGVLVDVAAEFFGRVGGACSVAASTGTLGPAQAAKLLQTVGGVTVEGLCAYMGEVAGREDRLEQLAGTLQQRTMQAQAESSDWPASHDVGMISGHLGVDLGLDWLGMRQMGMGQRTVPDGLLAGMDLDCSRPYCADMQPSDQTGEDDHARGDSKGKARKMGPRS